MTSSKMGGCKKKGRAGRKPSHQRYNIENRKIVNKDRKMAKQARKEEKQKNKKKMRSIHLQKVE